MSEAQTIGDRLREIRKRRGLTQQELAERSGVSLSWIKKLEQGEQQDTRLQTARKLAVVLSVPTSILVPPAAREAAMENAGNSNSMDAGWEPVRRALAGASTPQEPPGIDSMARSMQEFSAVLRAQRFSQARDLLPGMLSGTQALGEEGRDLHCWALHLAGYLLTHVRQFPDAQLAYERALDLAPDQAVASVIVNNQAWLLIRQGRLTDSRELVTRWADATEPRLSKASATEIAAWGWMLIQVAMTAVRDNRPGEAADALSFARAAADVIARKPHPHDLRELRYFGPAVVAMKTAEVAAITDRPADVLAISRSLPAEGMRPNRDNWHRHLLDVAAAHARLHTDSDALDVLQGLHRDSPEWLAHQNYARDILAGIIERRRTLTPEMRELADSLHLPL